MTNLEGVNRVAVIGIDGCGKTTTGHEAATLLSSEYPKCDIRVADSSGVTIYSDGRAVEKIWDGIDNLIQRHNSSRLRTICCMGAFLLSRQLSEQIFCHQKVGVTISIRDPYRIDPAVYAKIYGPEIIKGLSPERRLKLFHSLTMAAHPALIVHIETDICKARTNIDKRQQCDPHETFESLQIIAEDMPHVAHIYTSLFEIPFQQIDGLTPNSSIQLAETIERFVPN